MSAEIRDPYSRKTTCALLVAVICCALTIAWAPLADPPPAATKRVVVLHGDKAPYRAAAEALLATLRAAGHDCLSLGLPAGDRAAQTAALATVHDFNPDVLATGGASATAVVLREIPTTPIVFFMVPNALDAPFLASDSPDRERLAGVSSDVDPAVQMSWLAATSPDTRRVAILCSAHTERTTAALREAGQKRGLVIRPLRARRDAFPQAIDDLHESGCDGVIMIPDADVYDSPSVQRLLLWGVRQRKPVWTFSENVVKAGAFAGLSSDSEAVGRQAGRLVLDVLAGKAPASIGLCYPQDVDRMVNVHTAEMIGVHLSDRLLRSGVRKVGEKP